MARDMIQMTGIDKNYFVGTPNELHILKKITLTIQEGEFLSIVGASGSGKSTLMNLIGVLDRPSAGTYVLDGMPVSRMTNDQMSDIRCAKIGFVFQTFNLIPRNDALKNVELPMLYAGVDAKTRTQRAGELLELVGMGERMHHQPNELSGGQKQRVAIARALANDPPILLADEPTGSLDSATGRLVMDLFHRVHEKSHKTIILVTHNPSLAEETERIVTLRDGEIIDDRAGGGRAVTQ